MVVTLMRGGDLRIVLFTSRIGKVGRCGHSDLFSLCFIQIERQVLDGWLACSRVYPRLL